ncbi:hypothetical protein B0O99DRAFT_597450 [Bisporella sp. PMI_857]|nr:hypothetical protein B0O99DRAFT_597450 [Bisporella sp. PMI_857]
MSFSLLLDLPPELRSKIYALICTSADPISLAFPLAFPAPHHPLLLVSTQLYHEIRPIYFALNTFTLTIHRKPEAEYHHFLSPPFRDNRLQIPSIIISCCRFGSKHFLRCSLLPQIEDMILNGRLRRLEFQVSEEYWEGVRRGVRDARALGAIFRVLRDPYLERGRLCAAKEWTEGNLEGPWRDVTMELMEFESGKDVCIT